MDIGRPVSSSVASVSFSFLSPEDVRRLSVKQIVNPVLLDNFNQPNLGGLYDPALGPSTQRDVCSTCHLDYFQCPGHYGHIELPAPVYHPLFMMTTYKLLRSTCLFCHHFKAPRLHIAKTIGKLRLLERGLLEAAQALDAANFAEEKRKGDEDERDEVAEEKISRKVELYVDINLQHATSAKRGDYKDGPVYQARKTTIDDFLRVALANAKKCQRKQCGAVAYTFRKDGHTKIIEYDLTPKQKIQLDHLGLRRPDAFAYDAAIHRQSSSHKVKPQLTKSDSGSVTSSEMEVDEEINDEEMQTDEGSGDDTAEVVHIAKAANGRVKGARGRNERVVAPEEVRAHLRWLFRNESTACSLIFGRQGPYAPINASGFCPVSADIFFLEVLAVSPTRFRPPAKMGEQLFEHPHNQHLTKVINTSYRLRDITAQLREVSAKESTTTPDERNQILAKLFETLIVLQVDVNSYIDSSKNPTPGRQGKLPTPGIKQGLEKKEGLFRMHMMGKRVNYAARSVISPDVNIETNEIGIPPVFARKLTFPEPVTQHNVTELRELVIRGSNPKEGSGANMVQFEDGQTQSLDKLNLEQRTAIANQLLTPKELEKNANTLRPRAPVVGKKVYRHLRDGDMLILNRQPTLHKPSMMTHKAKILPGEKTIRMHYANCNSYNADFDGDEMNVHFPQSQIARSEAFNLACTDEQYLVPTSGKPLRGLIQDHVVGGVWLTNKSTFFTREEYQQLVYGALRPENNYTGNGRIHLLPPAIFKPRPLWTGKQIISTVLRNITPRNASPLTMKSVAQVKDPSWGRPRSIHPSQWDSDTVQKGGVQEKYEKNLSEERVLVFGGELVRGVLDKSQFGASAYGLVHSVYDVYGAEVAGRLLSIFSRLFTKYLQHRAFTCRMDDLVLTDEGEKARQSTMSSGATFGTEAASSFFNDLSQGPKKSETERKADLDRLLEKVLRDDAQMAGLDNIVKGKMTGLFEAVIKVIPNGLLRPFPDNHMQAMTTSGAKGSSTNARQISALLGQQELEGRRVPVMVSGKTLPSFRPFETAAIAGGYVASRFLTGLKPQEFYFHCMAGREGLIDTAVKTSRSGYLQRCLIKHLEGIQVHYDHTVRGADSVVYQFLYGEDGLDVTRQMHLSKFGFNLKNRTSLAAKFAAKALAGIVDEEMANNHMKRVMRMKRKHPDRALPDPTINTFLPSRHLGAVSEQFAQELDEYVSQNKNHLLIVKGNVNGRQSVAPTLHSKVFKSLMSVRYIRSLVEPGEAVGLLASQGVGEPSTQMTLNTFHFAGHGAANVTLGIPRLREIVMTAAVNPKTPMMNLPLVKGVSLLKVEEFCQKTSQLSLSHLIADIRITEHVRQSQEVRNKVFGVEMRFYPRSEYMAVHFVSTSQVILALGKLATILKRSIQAELKKLTVELRAQAASIGKGKSTRESRVAGRDDADDADAENEEVLVEDNDRDGSEVGDGDADAEKRQMKTKEQATYDEEEGDDADSESEDGVIADDAAIEAATDSGDEETVDEEKDHDSRTAEDQGLEAALEDIKEVFLSALPLIPDSWRYDHEHGLFFELEYDVNMPKLLLVDIMEQSCVKCIVREIPGIFKCHAPLKSHKSITNGLVSGDAEIVVEGTNLRSVAFLGEGVIDITRISTNSIHAILTTYGVEAARGSIVKEIKNVFDVYSIKVNVRHLMLIADYMTFDGGFKPFNRRGIATHSSPLLKASYETTAAFLSDATLHGDFDTLSTPSGNIIAGRPARSGTGAFDIILPIAS